jgi:hypothetical protein
MYGIFCVHKTLLKNSQWIRRAPYVCKIPPRKEKKGGILFVIFRSKRKLIMCRVRISNNVILGLLAWCQEGTKCGLEIPKTSFEFVAQSKDLIEY